MTPRFVGYGVPPGPLLAIWGMETGFGSQRGNQNMLSVVATLAYACRRTEVFTEPFRPAELGATAGKRLQRPPRARPAAGTSMHPVRTAAPAPRGRLSTAASRDGCGHIADTTAQLNCALNPDCAGNA